MEEHREESEFSGDCRESVEKAGKGSKIETLGGEVDVPQQDPSVKDSNTVENSDSGVCDVSGTDGGLATEDGSLKSMDGNSAVETKDSVEKTVSSDDVERTDAITDETERSNGECEGDAGAVEVEIKKIIVKPVDEAVKLGEVEMEDEIAMPEIERKNGASHESTEEKESETSDVDEVTDEKAKCEAEDNSGASDAEQNVQTEISRQSSVIDDQKKESTKKSEGDCNKVGVDNEHEKEEKVSVSYNEQRNSGCETSDADQEKESAKKSEDDTNNMDIDSKQTREENVSINQQGKPVAEESTQLIEGETNEGNPGAVSSAAEIGREEEITNVNQKEENGEAMEIDNAAEEQVEKDVIVDGALNDSNVKEMEMEIDERNDNVDVATDLTGKIESADSANPNSPTEDAATGEVEPLDHNALFDPTSDITNFIDFTGVSSWSGNIQDLKTETGDPSLKEDKKPHDMAEEVARENSKDTLKSVDPTVNAESSEACVAFEAESSAAAKDCPRVASDASLGSDDYQEDKDHERVDEKTVDQQDEMREEDDNAHEAPSIDPNQKEDTEMEENPNTSDYGTDSDMKTNGVKRKAEVLSEDSPGEGRKTVSFAKVSFAQGPSFKIGACIARAASQMAGSPAILKGSNFGDETLSVESFVSQLHCAATEPVKENVVSEVAADFFLEFRNSSASQQVTPEKVSSKRGRPSDSNVEGTEAFEFEEMGDTYWTDKVINNGGEEQTPPTEKAKYQVVPVELKAAQVQRTRRPYRRRQSQISIPLHSASQKPANFDENAPAELIMNFSETDTIPPEKNLSKMFRHFGPIRESETEVDKENNRARVVYRKGADAEVAYNSAGRFSIFGAKTVNYELSYTITETFKVKPYVVSLGEDDAALYRPA